MNEWFLLAVVGLNLLLVLVLVFRSKTARQEDTDAAAKIAADQATEQAAAQMAWQLQQFSAVQAQTERLERELRNEIARALALHDGQASLRLDDNGRGFKAEPSTDDAQHLGLADRKVEGPDPVGIVVAYLDRVRGLHYRGRVHDQLKLHRVVARRKVGLHPDVYRLGPLVDVRVGRTDRAHVVLSVDKRLVVGHQNTGGTASDLSVFQGKVE